MSAKRLHVKRDRVFSENGYRRQPLPEDVDHAGPRLGVPAVDQCAEAALRLRGLPGPTPEKKAA